MPVAYWAGGASGATTDTNNAANWVDAANGTNAFGSVPDGNDDVIIQSTANSNVSHNPTQTAAHTFNSIKIEAGGEWTADGSNHLTLNGEDGNDFAFTNNGTYTHANGTVVINNGGGGIDHAAIKNGVGNSTTGFYDLTISGGGTTCEIYGDTTIHRNMEAGGSETVLRGHLTVTGNLTVGATLNTRFSSTDKNLTVVGATSISGTLTCNASDISLGNNVDNAWSVVLEAGGTFTGGTGTHTLGAITLNSSSTQWNWSSGNSTLTGRSSSGNQYKVFNNFTAGKVTAAGTVIVDQARTPTSIRCDDTTGINNLTMNSGSGRVLHLEGDLTVGGTLNVSAGTVTTRNVGDSADNDLTVAGGNISVSGTLLLNNSTVVVSDTSSALSISNVGTVTCGNTNLTVNAVSLGQGSFTAPSASGSFIIDGEKDGLAFDYDGNGYVHNSGTIQIKTAASTFVDFTPNDAAHVDINNVTIDHASCVAKWTHACTIAGDLLIKQGTMEADDGDEAFTVQGDVTVGDGTGSANTAVLGNAADTAAMTFGSLMIASDGKYIATSGTTTITSNTATGTRSVYNNGGTFTHNKGTLKIDTGANTNYDFDGDNLYNFTVECEDGSGAMTCDGEASTAVTVLNNLDIKMGILRTNANSFTIHGNVFVRETSLTNKNKFVAQGANQTVKGLITVEDGAFFDMQNQGSGSFGTLTTGGIRVL